MPEIPLQGFHEEIGPFAQRRFKKLVAEHTHDEMPTMLLYLGDETPELTDLAEAPVVSGYQTWYQLPDARAVRVKEEYTQAGVGTGASDTLRHVVTIFNAEEHINDHRISTHEQFWVETTDETTDEGAEVEVTDPGYEYKTTLHTSEGNLVPSPGQQDWRDVFELADLGVDVEEPMNQLMDGVLAKIDTETALGGTTFTYERYGRVMQTLRLLTIEDYKGPDSPMLDK